MRILRPAQALHGLDFRSGEGRHHTLLGANGAGKTTILRAICGMVRTTGEIRFDGKPIDGWATEDIVRLGIAHVPEGRGTFLRVTVEENLQLGAMTRARPRRDRRTISSGSTPFPAAQGAADAAGRHAVGRRAADAGGRPRR